MERCNAYVTIPTSSSTPSMNLSHSVVVCGYELAKEDLGFPSKEVPSATMEERERLVKHALQLFDAAGYLTLEPRARKTQKIRNSLLRWNIRSADVRLFHGIFRYLMMRMK